MNKFLQGTLGMSVKFTGVILVAASVFLVYVNRTSWLAGVWGAWVWLGLNSFAIFQLLEIVRRGGEINRRKIFAICMVKFPVLYLLGLACLLLPGVAAEGVLVSFTVYLLIVSILWFRMKPLAPKV